MRITTLGRAAAFFTTFAGLAALPFGLLGCGGGGGGGGSTPTIPGTLAAIAVEGQSAPGTGAGVYGAFGTDVKVAVANNGWTAFVADVVGGTTTKGLFVVEPGGTVRLVYAKGNLMPDSIPGTGIIDDFERIFITSGGVVVALIDGNVPSFGFVTARVDVANGVLEKRGAIYRGATLPASVSLANPGTLTAINDDLVAVDDQGSIFFEGIGSGMSPIHGIYFVDRIGGGLVAVVATNDVLPGGGHAMPPFSGLGLDADGLIVAYAVQLPSGKGLFVTDVNLTTKLIAKNGDTPPNSSSRSFDDVHTSGPLLVSFSGGIGYLSWAGELSGSSPDRGVFSRQVAPSIGANLLTILAPGQSAAIPAGTGAVFADIRLLDCQQDPNRITLDANVSGGSTDHILYSSGGAGNAFLEILRQGGVAPGGGLFANSFPSFSTSRVHAADVLGSPAFTATLSDATTGVFWPIISNGFYAVAKGGGAAPGTGGGTFLPFGTPAVVTTATNVTVFRAGVTGGTTASGLFRQR